MTRAASIALLILALARPAVAAGLQHKPDLLSEAHWSSDIFLSETRVSYNQVATDFEWTAAVAYGMIDLEYRPFRSFDFLTQPAELHRDRYSADADFRPAISERVKLIFSGNFYSGFSDYRTAWLDEYYRQSYENIPGYEKAHPHGYSAGAGLRWEYLPSLAFLEAALSYGEDDVVPGYEAVPDPDFHVVRSPGSINKVGATLSSENVLAPFVRILNELAFTDSSGREPRYSYQFSANIAVATRWVFRQHAGYAREEPEFEAWYAGGALEFDVTDKLQLFARAAYYRDTGEILDSIAISGAPPGIETYQFGVGLRYSWPMAALQLYAGPHLTRYDDLPLGTQPFSNLYRDRNWGLAQAAFSVQF